MDDRPTSRRHFHHQRSFVGVDPDELRPWRYTDQGVTGASEGLGQAEELLFFRQPAGYRSPETVVVGGGGRCRKSTGTGTHGFAEEAAHGRDLLVGRRPLERRIAHGIPPQGGVTDLGQIVDPYPAAEAIDVLAEALPLPVQTSFEGVSGHSLDAGQHLDDEVAITWADG